MTSRQAVETNITRKIVGHYAFQPRDIAALQTQIESQLSATYRQVIAQQLRLYSCQKLATGPDATSLKWIRGKAKDDAQSIAATYLKELTNKVSSLRKESPKGNRFFYLKNLEIWSTARDKHKIPSIGLNTATAARAYAQDRFIRENKITGRFAPVGPPPVCIKCVRIFAKGALTWVECQKPQNFLPAHVSCPHTRSALVIKPIPCNELTWTG